jgi:hypothetical protein
VPGWEEKKLRKNLRKFYKIFDFWGEGIIQTNNKD